MKREKIIIGSRGSILALAQSENVKEMLEKAFPDLKIEIKKIVTRGDKDLVSNWNNSDKSLKSFFTKEIELELLEGTIDIAVHSMKDMPAINPEGLICGAIPKREDNRDVLVSREGKKIFELPAEAIIGTSSLRRTVGIKNLREDLVVKQLRGNIHTRLKKLDEGEYDAILLAAAGLKRVGLEERITQYFDYDELMPAPAQGALYIQCREEDEFVRIILNAIHDKEVEEVVTVEREFSKIFDGGCHTPMGCAAFLNGENLSLKGIFCKEGKVYKTEVEGSVTEGITIAERAAKKIKERLEDE
jgi:hydroxymethylbilane synthase